MTDADRDHFLLTFVAYAEASSEPQEGIRGQIHSVLNRFREGDWDAGHTIAATLMMPYAYSALNTKDPNRVRAACAPCAEFVWRVCEEEARAALAGETDDPTDGATHYYVDGTPEPAWVSGKRNGVQVAPPATFTRKIGKHLFYKGVK